MQLKLNLSGSAEPLINYLKSYARIRESLLLEVDTNARAFVAKAFTEDKSSIRFASITFEEANISVVSDDGADERGQNRIKVGILLRLKKFIQIIERFGADADSDGKSVFDFIITYGPMDRIDKETKAQYTDFVSTELKFSSDKLNMKMNGFRINEFKYLSDETFSNVVFNVGDPVYLDIRGAELASIVKTSEIIKFDPRKDMLIFYVEGSTLYVKDQGDGDGKNPNFTYKIGELNAAPGYDIFLPFNREKFIKLIDKSEEDFKVILGRVFDPESNQYVTDRALFDSLTSTTKLAVSIMKDY